MGAKGCASIQVAPSAHVDAVYVLSMGSIHGLYADIQVAPPKQTNAVSVGSSVEAVRWLRSDIFFRKQELGEMVLWDNGLHNGAVGTSPYDKRAICTRQHPRCRAC
jgi:hypothetical protein